jgi:ketosteroid isomerase-like protein
MLLADAVDAHLDAIARRDLDAYLATVHADVTMIMPNGALLTGRDAAAEVQREWFGDPDWSWDVEVLHSTSAGDTGVALLAVDYRDVDAGGRPYAMAYLLGLVFVRVGAGWLLLHDQNTVR